MKPRSNPFLRTVALGACIFAASFSSAIADNGWWNTGDGNWSDVANWWTTVGGTTLVGSVPTTGQTAFFNGTGVNGNQIVYLDGNQAASSLTFANTGTTTLLGGVSGTPANNTLTLSTSAGITTSTGAGLVTIGDTAASPTAKVDLLLSANQNFTTATGTTLTIANGVSASTAGLKTISLIGAGTTNFNGVIADGSGQVGFSVTTIGQTINFNQSNTFTGAFSTGTLTSGTFGIGANDALGLGVITTNTSNQSTYAHTLSVNGNYTLNNSAINFGRANHIFSGTGSLTFTNKLTTNSSGTTLTNNLGGSLNLGAVDISSTSSNATLTLAGTGNTNVSGIIANGNSSTASNLTVNNTGITTLSNNNTFAGLLTLGTGSNVVLAGANSFSGAITLNNGSTLKLANADALGSTTGIVGANSSISTLWLANNSAINNLKINSNNNFTVTTRTIVDRATAGADVDHSIAFTSGRGNFTFQKGTMVTSGTPLITASGDTTFGSGTNITAALILNPLGVNLSFGNLAAAITGAGASSSNGLVLDGNTTGNKITGVISNGGTSVAALTPTITATSGSQTVTVSSATSIAVGALLSGYSGIPDGTMVTAVSGSTLTLSQVTTAGMTNATGSITSRVNAANLIKAGPGTWSLSGVNIYTGSTTVQGGTLNLDFSAAGAPTNDILFNNMSGTAVRPTVTVAGGNLQLIGKGSGGSNVQTLSTLAALGSTSSKITVGGGVSGSTVTLQMATLTNNTNSLLDVSGMDAFNIVNATGASGGNNARITTNNYTDFGFIDAGKNIVAAGANISTALPGSTAGGTSSFFTLSGNVTRDTASVAFKGIRVTGGSGTLDLGGLQLQASSGSNSAILYSGSGTYNITNGTLISSSTGATEFNFITADGSTLNIDSTAAINDNTGVLSILTGGLGTVSVAGGKNYTGVNRILGGTYSIDTLANGGTASGLGASTNGAANLIISGATVKYTGSQAAPTTDRSFTIGSNGATLDASGTNALTWAPAAALAYAANQNNYLTLTGTNTGNNIFGGGGGPLTNGAAGFTTLTKAGSGKWVLAGLNHHTGGTYIDSGTLEVREVVNASSTTGTSANGSPVVTGIADTSALKIGQLISGPGFSNATIRSIDSSSQVTLNSNAGTGFGTGALTAQAGTSLGVDGPIVFGGGTLQYSATNTVDYSKRILLSTGAISINTNGQAVTFASALDSSNVGGLTKSGAGTLTLANSNLYTGATSVMAGKLVVTGSGSLANTDVSVTGSDTILASGSANTVGKSLSVGNGAILAAGDAGAAGTATVTNATTFNNGSIFSWDVNAAGTGYDKLVSGTGLVDGGTEGGAVFRVVLADTAFADSFWDTTQTWTNIFTTDGTDVISDWANIFTSITVVNSAFTTFDPSAKGSFTASGNTLTWTVVPEPTSALAGLLIAAGLLRRRRESQS
jgi:fibronectin-binding autotransporter adhesin